MKASKRNFVSNQDIEFAIFPLPDMVAFPGQNLSLHVFEPRYRQMVKDCVKEKRPLGLALPKKVLAESRESDQSLQELLSSNQTTYEPVATMGIGQLRMDEVSSDGRIYIQIEIQDIVEVKELIQEVPYFLAKGKVLKDDPIDSVAERVWSSRLHEAYETVLQSEKKLIQLFRKTLERDSLSLSEWTYLIFKWCKMEASFMQQLLELRNPLLRAQILMQVLLPYSFNVENESDQKKDREGKVLPFPDLRDLDR